MRILAASAVLLCANAAGADAETPTGWVVLTVAQVEVEPTDAQGNPWDKAPPQQQGIYCDKGRALSCDGAKAAGRIAGGSLGGHVFKGACSLARNDDACRHQTRPDLGVEVTVANTRFVTPVVRNALAAAFNWRLVVPLAEVPVDGLQIDVFDYHGPGRRAQNLGAVRVTRQMLEDAVANGQPLIAEHAGKIVFMQLEVNQYVPQTQPRQITFNVANAPTSMGGSAMAGELVIFQATGRYSVASNRKQIDERGYTDGSKQSYNARLFAGRNHGAAIAYVGSDSGGDALFVGSCNAVIAKSGGPITVGVNDKDESNNVGTVAFTAWALQPTREQWRLSGIRPCR